jgi:hypothetical protein
MEDNKFYVAATPLINKQHDLIKKAVDSTEMKLKMCTLIQEQKTIEINLFRTQLVKLKFLKEKIEDNIRVFHPQKHAMINEWFNQINDASQYNEIATKLVNLNEQIVNAMNAAKKSEEEYVGLCKEFEELDKNPNTRKDLYAVDADDLVAAVEKVGESTVMQYAAEFIERDAPN